MSAVKAPVWHRVLTHVVLIVVVLITLYPIVQILGISLRPGDKLYSTSLSLIPEGASLHSYRVVIFEKPFMLWLRNSAIVSLSVTLIGVTLAATSGYAFSRFRFPGHRPALVSFLVTQMFPATMLLLPLYVLQKLHLLDSLLGLMVVYVTTALPFCVWTMKGYYDSIPRDLEEAALIDGLGPMGAFVRIVLPLSLPALTITALFSFMAAWSEFIVARVVLQNKDLYTLPLGLEGLAGTFQTEWANYAAGSVLVSIPVVVLFLLLNRFLVSGLTLGGVKG
jgi:arabinogalactan oligomer/maltooligosaccharide transport system permease protein